MLVHNRDKTLREPTNDSRVPHIGTYRRELPVNNERLYENAIDWEHLPYLHRSTFSRIECLAAGTWGFRGRVWQTVGEDRPPFIIELKLDRTCRRWITKTLDGPGCGSEVWTHAFPMGARRTDIVVDFFVPRVSAERAAALRESYTKLYARLYDEDVWMMTVRQERLDQAKAGRAPADIPRLALGSLAQLRQRLPITLSLGGRSFRLIEVDGQLIAHAVVCPHLLGPLEDAKVRNGVVECPWHGYRFDVITGNCVSGGRCALAPAPTVRVDAAQDVFLESKRL
ncbi:MAG: Rieske 2Fe-2S domain-containing protein [Candidatus Binataceae bacterium]